MKDLFLLLTTILLLSGCKNIITVEAKILKTGEMITFDLRGDDAKNQKIGNLMTVFAHGGTWKKVPRFIPDTTIVKKWYGRDSIEHRSADYYRNVVIESFVEEN